MCDGILYGIGFAIIGLPYAIVIGALAMVLTASARFQHQSNPWAWAGNLALTAMGMLATLAASPRAFVLAWTAIDLGTDAKLRDRFLSGKKPA